MHPLDDEDAPRFAVGQVAEMLDVQPAFVRRLDSEEVMQRARSAGGQRRYSRADIDQVRRVAEMARCWHDPCRHPPHLEARGRAR
jgi:MerR family transcriptional regulator/heat shock protein HspR